MASQKRACTGQQIQETVYQTITAATCFWVAGHAPTRNAQTSAALCLEPRWAKSWVILSASCCVTLAVFASAIPLRAAKPEDWPAACQLQHQISSRQERLRDRHATTGQGVSLYIQPQTLTCQSDTTQHHQALLVVLINLWCCPSCCKGSVDQWMPVPSTVYTPTGPKARPVGL